MISLVNGLQLVMCITNENKLHEGRSLFPIKTFKKDKIELFELLEKNNLITTNDKTDTYISIEIKDEKIIIEHSVKNGTEFDFNSLRKHNKEVDIESFYVIS